MVIFFAYFILETTRRNSVKRSHEIKLYLYTSNVTYTCRSLIYTKLESIFYQHSPGTILIVREVIFAHTCRHTGFITNQTSI
jgi:hypothetical protein